MTDFLPPDPNAEPAPVDLARAAHRAACDAEEAVGLLGALTPGNLVEHDAWCDATRHARGLRIAAAALIAAVEVARGR